MSPNTGPSVAVLILTWNQRERTLKCLQSISQLHYPAERLYILVVDNASTDGTVAAVRDNFPRVGLVINPSNFGYAAGNNVGLRYIQDNWQADYLLVANNDVTWHPDSLRGLVAAAEVDRQAGFLGPKIYQSNSDRIIQSAGTVVSKCGETYQRGLNQVDEGQFDLQQEVDSLVGCAILVRTSALERIGLLDERFFLYREDIDWCVRARTEGFKVLYVPNSVVWHRSSNVRAGEVQLFQYYTARNSYLLLRKNGFPVSCIFKLLLRHLLWLINWTFDPKWSHKRCQREALLKAVTDALCGKYGQQPHTFRKG